MNRRPPGLLLSTCIDGFLQYKVAEGLSPNTLYCYRRMLRQWLKYAGDIKISEVGSQDISAYLAWLRTEYIPSRWNGDTSPLSAKTIRNVWVALSSFYSWAEDEFELAHPMRKVPAPRFQKAVVDPFTKEDVEKLLKACKYCRTAYPRDRSRFTMQRFTARRDQAIVCTLLDTGLRATELCTLRIGDYDQRTGRIEVRHGQAGGAKGGKGRFVLAGKSTRRAIWRYLAEREDADDPEAPLFTGKFDRPINKNALRRLIARLGERAGVKDCYPHRFRHTFAITYLRSGGDVFTLQALLGHSSLDTVKWYAHIAQVDVERAHRKASPVDNWRL